MRGRLFTLVSCLCSVFPSSTRVHAASLTEQRRSTTRPRPPWPKATARPTWLLAQRPARLPAGTLPGPPRRTDPPAEVRQQRGGRALPHRTRRPAADRLAETALAAPAGRPRRLEDLRQLLRSEAELHRTRLPVWLVPAGPRPEGRRLRHQRTPVAGRQVAAGCLATPVRLWRGEGQLTEEKV